MMHIFLSNNRAELIARCKAKVAQRPHRAASEAQLRNGIPIFLEQLQQTLEAEESNDPGGSLRISGGSGALELVIDAEQGFFRGGEEFIQCGRADLEDFEHHLDLALGLLARLRQCRFQFLLLGDVEY